MQATGPGQPGSARTLKVEAGWREEPGNAKSQGGVFRHLCRLPATGVDTMAAKIDMTQHLALKRSFSN